MIISDFHQFGSRHTETGAMRNVLNHLGVTVPETGQPFTEELLFGIGGGIGFAYFLFEKSGSHHIQLSTRIHTKETERPEFLQEIARRIGCPLRIQNSSSASAAASNLSRHLERGATPVVSVDPVRLPYLGLNAAVRTYYCVVVYGVDDANDRVLLSDRCPEPVTMTRDEFRVARETSWSPKYRAVVIERPVAEPDLRAAVTEGIQACCRQMHEGLGITNFGLRGMEKWATVLTSSKEKKSWPKIFSPGPLLFEALYAIFAQISGRSGTGNAQRAYYADFLEQAGDLLSNPGLRDAAQSYRHCDEMWGEIADAHLPTSVPLFAEAKDLTLLRRNLFEEKGVQAFDEIRRVHDRMEEITADVGANFPLSFQDSRALLNDVRQRVLKLREAEAAALRALESAIGARQAPQGGEALESHIETPELEPAAPDSGSA
jgi:hypothetical protein